MSLSNYPPGVTGLEPEITGDWPEGEDWEPDPDDQRDAEIERGDR